MTCRTSHRSPISTAVVAMGSWGTPDLNGSDASRHRLDEFENEMFYMRQPSRGSHTQRTEKRERHQRYRPHLHTVRVGI